MDKKSLLEGHRKLRVGRRSIPGQMYFITVACKNRENRFLDFSIASTVSRKIANDLTWSDAKLLAWVLMPDHYHVLLQLGSTNSLSVVMKRANVILALATNKASLQRGQVWQSAFYDHGLRHDACVESVARYIIANPIRKGLVDDVGQYSYWNAFWLDNYDSDIL